MQSYVYLAFTTNPYQTEPFNAASIQVWTWSPKHICFMMSIPFNNTGCVGCAIPNLTGCWIDCQSKQRTHVSRYRIRRFKDGILYDERLMLSITAIHHWDSASSMVTPSPAQMGGWRSGFHVSGRITGPLVVHRNRRKIMEGTRQSLYPSRTPCYNWKRQGCC